MRRSPVVQPSEEREPHEGHRLGANCARVTKLTARVALAAALFACAGCGHRAIPSAPATPSPLPYATGDFPEYGLAPDLSWVAGKVFVNVRSPACTYVLFSSGRGAQWGGVFVLSAAPGVLIGLHAGDRVVLHGSLAAAPMRGCDARQFSVTRVELH